MGRESAFYWCVNFSSSHVSPRADQFALLKYDPPTCLLGQWEIPCPATTQRYFLMACCLGVTVCSFGGLLDLL